MRTGAPLGCASRTLATRRFFCNSVRFVCSPIRISTKSSVVSSRGSRLPGMEIAELPRINAILLTHAHADHLSFRSLHALPKDIPDLRTTRDRSMACSAKGSRPHRALSAGSEIHVGSLKIRSGSQPSMSAHDMAWTVGAAMRTCICSTMATRRCSSPAIPRSRRCSRRTCPYDSPAASGRRTLADRRRAMVETMLISARTSHCGGCALAVRAGERAGVHPLPLGNVQARHVRCL